MSSDTLGYLAILATLFGFPLGVFVFITAAYQLRLGRLASSGSTVVTTVEAFRQSWGHFLSLDGQPRQARWRAFADVANLVEIGCALHCDGNLAGRAGKVLEDYLISVLRELDDDPLARAWLSELIEQPHTFNNMAEFKKRHWRRLEAKR